MRHRYSWAALAIAICLSAGCRSQPGEEPSWPGEVNHVVLCWMKDPNDVKARQRLIDASNSFRAIPGVVAVRAGPRMEFPVIATMPSSGTAEPPFDVGVVITFVNRDALLSYQIDPIHQHAVREVLVPYVRERRTYDFMTK